MESPPNSKLSTRSELIAVLVSTIAGFGIGYSLWLATDSRVVGLGTASPVAVLVNNFIRNALAKGQS